MKNIPFFDQVYHHQKIDSTYIEAKKLINSKQAAGNFLIVADQQTAGIGRKGNVWYSPSGGLWFTAGIYGLPVKNGITIFTALMIINTLEKIFPEIVDLVGVKWPNDIYLDGKKLGGILTSYYPSLQYLLIGVGINTANEEIPEELAAISLKKYLNDYYRQEIPIDNKIILRRLFNNFGDKLPFLLEEDLSHFLKDYYSYSILEGKRVTLDTSFQDFSGIVKGINKEGAILLELNNGMIQPFLSGSIIKWE